MSDILRCLEERRQGRLTSRKFKNNMTEMIPLKYNRKESAMVTIPAPFEYSAVCNNRLLLTDATGLIRVYDMADEQYDSLAPITVYVNGSIKPRMAKCCTKWCDFGSFFTFTGTNLSVELIDAETFSCIDKLDIPDAKYINMHQPRPYNEKTIAGIHYKQHSVATSEKHFSIVDMIVGSVSMSGFQGHHHSIKTLTFSPDSSLLLTSNHTEKLLWDLRQEKYPVSTIDLPPSRHTVPTIEFLDYRTIVVLQNTNVLYVYDLMNSQVVKSITTPVPDNATSFKFVLDTDSKNPTVFIPALNYVDVIDLKIGESKFNLGPMVDFVQAVLQNEITKDIYSFSKFDFYAWTQNIQPPD